MKITVKIVPQAKHNALKMEGEVWKVYVTAPALEGRANQALIVYLAEHFGVSKTKIEIIKGLHSRNKIVNIVGI